MQKRVEEEKKKIIIKVEIVTEERLPYKKISGSRTYAYSVSVSW